MKPTSVRRGVVVVLIQVAVSLSGLQELNKKHKDVTCDVKNPKCCKDSAMADREGRALEKLRGEMLGSHRARGIL